MQIDMRVMELLASKLCHDLISPVGAINNGVELIEDIGGDVVDEAMKLIGDSAMLASRRLRLYRTAYGRAGSDNSLAVKDVKQIAEHYLAAGKTTLVWPDEVPVWQVAEQRGYLKTALNLVVLAEELLPYGGVVTLSAAEEGCRFAIVGRNAQLSPLVEAALEGKTEVEELTPRSIQAYVTGRFAEQFGLRLVHEQVAVDSLRVSLLGEQQ